MKKLLLSAFLLVGTFTQTNAQVVLTSDEPLTFTGGNYLPIVEAGDVTGTLTGIEIEATFTNSVSFTYANDLSVIVTETDEILSTLFLQVGGFSDFGAEEYMTWSDIDADTSTVPTTLNSSETLTTPITFTESSTYVIWIGNGYGGSGASGTWDAITLTLQGLQSVDAGTGSFSAASFKVYPNPATNVVNVSSYENAIEAITVADINGRIVKRINGNEANIAQLNISDLSVGVYTISVTSNNVTAVKKFVKQ